MIQLTSMQKIYHRYERRGQQSNPPLFGVKLTKRTIQRTLDAIAVVVSKASSNPAATKTDEIRRRDPKWDMTLVVPRLVTSCKWDRRGRCSIGVLITFVPRRCQS